MTFKEITDLMVETYEKKNHDYGNSFDKSVNEFGLVSPAIRLTDKLNRFKTLIKTESKVKDESISDTLLDLANYSILTYLYIKNHNEL
jgi:hypothetical protein